MYIKSCWAGMNVNVMDKNVIYFSQLLSYFSSASSV
jgi:hypothetical protein